MAKLVYLTVSWGIVGCYWVSAWFPVLDIPALLFLEKNMVVAILAHEAGSRAENERFSAAWRLVWWVDPDRMSFVHQSHSVTPLLGRIGEKKK